MLTPLLQDTIMHQNAMIWPKFLFVYTCEKAENQSTQKFSILKYFSSSTKVLWQRNSQSSWPPTCYQKFKTAEIPSCRNSTEQRGPKSHLAISRTDRPPNTYHFFSFLFMPFPRSFMLGTVGMKTFKSLVPSMTTRISGNPQLVTKRCGIICCIRQ